MENQPLVSVIIPVYNVEEYLCECIDSVINQTYKNIEIILIDDGSTDSSGKICDKYADKDSRISVVHQENGGPSKSRNVGLEKTKGKYIYFLDSDDYIELNALELLVETAESADADLVFFDAHSFSDDGAQIKQGYVIKGTYEAKSGYEILTELHDNKDYHCAIYLLLISRKLIKDNKIAFLESAYCSEDMLFTYQIYCHAKKAVQCKQTLYNRRYHSGSIVTSGKSRRHFRSCCDVYEEIRDFSERIGKIEDHMATNYVVRCAFNALDTYKKIPKKEQLLCKAEYMFLKQDILSHLAYSNKALKMRCYGKLFWFVYKVLEKTVGRLLKGKK